MAPERVLCLCNWKCKALTHTDDDGNVLPGRIIAPSTRSSHRRKDAATAGSTSGPQEECLATVPEITEDLLPASAVPESVVHVDEDTEQDFPHHVGFTVAGLQASIHSSSPSPSQVESRKVIPVVQPTRTRISPVSTHRNPNQLAAPKHPYGLPVIEARRTDALSTRARFRTPDLVYLAASKQAGSLRVTQSKKHEESNLEEADV
ncbi:hypothetical protein DFP72DRAFT_1062696 [Ephemerocybe angulata]|uniref:Uncharacterized protein n=1 Tax=Ephemerocybe angulata TaxID=980116 RepID=A0A8H6MDD1_9AGAR|nr:hypothetical protein DFP72DRAFT_1062696 [Tulosesus angulatus]